MKKDLKNLLIEELHDILSAEEQIVEALPKMVKASESSDLKKAFETHLKETKEQIHRLEKIFKFLKIEKKEKLCKGAKGLIQECKEVLKDFKTKSPIRDAALISKAQRIEHYEMSAYGTMRTFAKEMNIDEVADLLQETLDEEGNADKQLTKIAEGGLFTSGINQQAIPNRNNLLENKKINSKKPKISSKSLNTKISTSKKTKSNTINTKSKSSNNKMSSAKKTKSVPPKRKLSLAKK